MKHYSRKTCPLAYNCSKNRLQVYGHYWTRAQLKYQAWASLVKFWSQSHILDLKNIQFITQYDASYRHLFKTERGTFLIFKLYIWPRPDAELTINFTIYLKTVRLEQSNNLMALSGTFVKTKRYV